MTCKKCKERGKDWNGDDPQCAFVGEFHENWNCATLNAIRDICHEGQDPMPPGVDYRYCDDQKYATIQIDGIHDSKGNWIGYALWVCWYKSRGRTEAVWVLDSDGPPRRPTEDELLSIIAAFRQPKARNATKGKL